NRLVFLIGCLTAIFAQAQDRYVVHYGNKQGTPYSVSNPAAYLSQRAIDRRTRQGISVTTADFPVNPDYMSGVKNTGARIFYSSRWLNCTLVDADDVQAGAIRALPFVTQVELVAPGPHAAGRIKSVKARKGSGIAAPTLHQLRMVGIDSMHIDGIRGEGV